MGMQMSVVLELGQSDIYYLAWIITVKWFFNLSAAVVWIGRGIPVSEFIITHGIELCVLTGMYLHLHLQFIDMYIYIYVPVSMVPLSNSLSIYKSLYV